MRMDRTAAFCRKRSVPALLALVLCSWPASAALAWGSSGHRLVTLTALQALPPELPGFLRDPVTASDAAEWAREPDRWREAGEAHDVLRDSFHFAYADDAGRLGGVLAFSELPGNRTAYEAELRKAGVDPDTVGSLPYAIMDGWQQLTKDLAYWRADRAGLRFDRNPQHLAWLEADRRRRETQITEDIGLLSHYVGDATQPMHLSVHHDGWGAGPNPDGYTTARVHIASEGAYVAATVTPAAVRAALPDAHPLTRAVAPETLAWLEVQSTAFRTWYRMEKDGAFKPGDPRGAGYTAQRLGLAAGMLRDIVAAAWTSSATGHVNYPVVNVRDLESGRSDAYAVLHGAD